MTVLNLISLLAGLALFLYGITLMGDGLNLVAGNKPEVVLYRLTSSRFRGILLGALVTAVIQSSSATSVMCVGDHCSNVAVAMIELKHDVFDTHEYLDSRLLLKDAAFAENYEQFYRKYNIDGSSDLS